MNLLYQFIPDLLKQQKIAYRSTKMILNINLIVLISTFFLIPLFFSFEFYPGVYIMMYTLLMTVLFGFVVYFSGQSVVIGSFFAINSMIVFIGLISQTGGMNSPFLIWLISVPTVAFLSLPRRHGLFWSVVCVFSFIVMAYMEFHGFQFPEYLSGRWQPVFKLSSYGLVSMLFVYVITSYLSSYRNVKHQLKDINKDLKESNSDLDQFAAIASHDLKSPLRSIVSFGGLMEMKYGDILPEEGKEYLKIMTNNARQMNHLIEDILEYSKNNSYEQKKERLEMNRLISYLAREVKLNKGYEDATIECNELPVLFADQTWIKQLFQNLIFNGLKYNENPKPHVTIQYEERGDGLYFQVIDNGIGIAPRHQEKIFEMFKRLHGQGTYEGTGIGLATCKKIMYNCGGKIWVSSSEGNGATFHLLFPSDYLFQNKVVKQEEKVVVAI